MKKKHTILICDDDPDILELTSELLEAEGFLVDRSRNCNDIVETIKATKPSIVLMDLRIPGIGGKEAARLIKTDSETKDIPVYLFTANNAGKNVAKEVGADGVIEKPFDIEELVNLIHSRVD